MAIKIIGNDDALYQATKRNKIVYFLIMTVFAIGILAGSTYLKNTSDISNTSKYIEESLSELSDSDTVTILRESLIKNVTISIFFWILGASIIASPFLLGYIGYKGFTLGFTITSLLQNFGILRGNILSFMLLFFQNSFSFLGMLIAMTSSIKLSINLLLKRKDIKMELLRHSVISVISLAFFVCASFADYLTKGTVLVTILDKIR